MPPALVIFDLDGTLADSYPWFLRHVNGVADRFGFRRIAAEDVEALRHAGSATSCGGSTCRSGSCRRSPRHMRRLKAAIARRHRALPRRRRHAAHARGARRPPRAGELRSRSQCARASSARPTPRCSPTSPAAPRCSASRRNSAACSSARASRRRGPRDRRRGARHRGRARRRHRLRGRHLGLRGAGGAARTGPDLVFDRIDEIAPALVERRVSAARPSRCPASASILRRNNRRTP